MSSSSFRPTSFQGGSDASAFTSRSERSPRPDVTPVTPPPSTTRASLRMDDATATLIGQLVATDMARQDHKDKAQSQAVIVKQRPPPPHRTPSHSQHSRASSVAPATTMTSPVSLSQHLQRTSVAVAARSSISTATASRASLERSQESDRKPAAVVTPVRSLLQPRDEDDDEVYAAPSPNDSPRRHSPRAARVVTPSLRTAAPPLTHDQMLQDKRRARISSEAVGTPRPKYVPEDALPSRKTAADDALQHAKCQERDRGPALASVVRRTPSRASAPSTASNRSPETASRSDIATKSRPSASDDALQHAKQQERERGPALAPLVRRTPSRQGSQNTAPLPTLSPAPDTWIAASSSSAHPSSSDDALQQAKQQERERGPALAPVVRRTPSRQGPPSTSERTSHETAVTQRTMVPSTPRSATPDDALQQAKQQERARGPRLLLAARRSRRAPAAAPVVPTDSHRTTTDDEKQAYRVGGIAVDDDDDDASTDSAYALAMARSNLQQHKLQSEPSAGPSLATATGAVEVHPGAVAFLGPELHRKSGALHVAAGVPVPGAFAVQGLSASAHDDDSEDSLQDDDDAVDALDHYGDVDLENPHAAGTTTLETTTPVEAEIYEQVVVDGAIADADDEEEILDPKTVRRLRTVQLSILGCALLAVGIIIGSILGLTSRGGHGDGGPPPVLGWQPVGSTLFGANTDTPQTLFGSALALSADGQRLVVAAPGTDNGTALNVGAVYLMETYQNENGTQWRTLETRAGPGPSPEAHMAVALAESTLAVGYSRYTLGGPVQVWQTTSSDENSGPVAVPVVNASEDAWWGYALDLSADGTLLAVGAPRMNGPYGVSSGVVQVFQWHSPSSTTASGGNASWIPLGASLYGTSVDEFFGWTVSLSAGPRLAVGAPVYNDTSGVVRLYDWNAGRQEWVPGADLRGDEPLGRFGESVALSGSDGTVLAVGARGSAFDEGYVKIYRETNGQWVADDAKLLQGQETGEGYGAAVALSWDGGTLAVGAPQSNYFGPDTGAVSVYRYSTEEASWKQHGTAMGSALMSEFGASVSLSDDGLRVAGGAPTTAFDGSVSRAGAVLVYDLVELSS